jgi:tRNA threonylcarbamoyl adenosine modification protein (Sua5/YciO/YrdC/YwlC family)
MRIVSSEVAASELRSGKVGVLATDTVYGIVARAADPAAVKRFYALKQREHKPGTVIAADVDQLIELGLDRRYIDRVKHLWPGALSVETPLDDSLAYLHQETGRQGFRVVANQRVADILRVTGPLVTSSANQPGMPPSNTIEEAFGYFGDTVDFYVDAGDRSGGAPSTIIKLTDEGVEVIRAGAVDVSTLMPAQPSSQAKSD